MEYYDRVFLLTFALTNPIETDYQQPDQLPPGIECVDGVYRLYRSNLPMCWVAPTQHWIGMDDDRQKSNSIRIVEPTEGFFISQTPVSEGLVEWVNRSAGINFQESYTGY